MKKTNLSPDLIAHLAAHGLAPRGAILFDQNDDPPLLANTMPAKSLILIGHAGSSIWPHFSKWLSRQNTRTENPLDAWSKETITTIANQFGGEALFPSDKPYHPFQQWAMRTEGLKPSPLGILIHPVYGLSHAYRGALIFDEMTPSQCLQALSQPVQKLSHPCDTCVAKPCLTSCPVSAFSDEGYDVDHCRSYLLSPSGQSCMDTGCKARGACPIGGEYKYSLEHLQFHMKAFAK